jgi:hypothetical protein
MADEKMMENVDVMNNLEGFDVVIVCTGNELQAKYWQQRLTDGKGSVVSSASVILAVHEDWPGGAGNGKWWASLLRRVQFLLVCRV